MGAVYTPEAKIMLWRVIEDFGVALYRPSRKTVQLPGRQVQGKANAIETQRHIGSFAQCHQASGAKGHFLASYPERQRRVFSRPQQHKVKETLVQVQFVLIHNPARTASPPIF